MAIYDLPAELLRNDKITDSIFLLTFRENPIGNLAVPGQFVMVKTGSGKDPLLRRPFSIHQITPDGNIQLIVRVAGKGTELLSELTEGDTVQMLGPLGNGFDLSAITSETSSITLVGGGMGVAPLLFLASRLARQSMIEKIRIILGARYKHELLCLYAFKELGVSIQCITDDGSSGQQGFVTELLQENVEDHLGKVVVFSCGPKPMLMAVAAICQRFSTPCQLSMETYMACGISACLGCAIPAAAGSNKKFIHVCKDGPVFQRQEIAWDKL